MRLCRAIFEVVVGDIATKLFLSLHHTHTLTKREPVLYKQKLHFYFAIQETTGNVQSSEERVDLNVSLDVFNANFCSCP